MHTEDTQPRFADKATDGGNSLVVQWLGHSAFTAMGLVRELRSRKLCSVTKKNKTKNNNKKAIDGNI